MTHILVLINTGAHRHRTVQRSLVFAQALGDCAVHLACDTLSDPFSPHFGSEALERQRSWDVLEEARVAFDEARIPVCTSLLMGDLLEVFDPRGHLYTLAVMTRPVSARLVETLVNRFGLAVVLVGASETLIVPDDLEPSGRAALSQLIA